jgi:hypothetical protein
MCEGLPLRISGDLRLFFIGDSSGDVFFETIVSFETIVEAVGECISDE